MKKRILVLPLFAGSILATQCQNGKNESDESNVISTFEHIGHGDTVNVTDSHGRKQGIWIKHESKDTVFYNNGSLASVPEGWKLKNNTFNIRLNSGK